MAYTGKLIVFEGIDGSGKGTQTELLCQAIAASGLPLARFGFPQYERFFGKLIAKFLNGEFGSLELVNPHFSALIYAGDRFEAKGELERALESGRTVIVDRYVSSNLAHQTARVALGRRAEFISWLKQLEYGIYGLPQEDLIIYLKMPPAAAQHMVAGKGARNYTRLTRDLQESDLNHLEQTAAIYDQLATSPNWVTIECLNPESGAHKTPQDIHRMIMDVVRDRVLSGVSTR